MNPLCIGIAGGSASAALSIMLTASAHMILLTITEDI